MSEERSLKIPQLQVRQKHQRFQNNFMILQLFTLSPYFIQKKKAHTVQLPSCVLKCNHFSSFVSAGGAQIAAVPRGRIYTVLPPPADYKKHLENSVTLPQLESINSANNPAGKTTIISHSQRCAMHHKTRRNLCHEFSPGWLPVLESLSLIVAAILVKRNRRR